MQKNVLLSIIFMAVFLNMDMSYSKTENILLKDIIGKIEKYKKKSVTLKLKLKFIDKIFGRILFYDSSNDDIEFDISSKNLQKKLKLEILNLHEGMDYIVTFTVSGVGNYGLIIADLIEFKPAILDKIP